MGLKDDYLGHECERIVSPFNIQHSLLDYKLCKHSTVSYLYDHPHNAEYIMWNTRLDEAQAGIKIAGRNISNLR